MLDATIKNIEWKRSQRKPNTQKSKQGIKEKLKDPNSPLYKTDWIADMKKQGYPTKYINKCKRVASDVLHDPTNW